jgi:hypothetical protein
MKIFQIIIFKFCILRTNSRIEINFTIDNLLYFPFFSQKKGSSAIDQIQNLFALLSKEIILI